MSASAWPPSPPPCPPDVLYGCSLSPPLGEVHGWWYNRIPLCITELSYSQDRNCWSNDFYHCNASIYGRISLSKIRCPILGSKIDVIIGAHSPSSVVCINFHLYFIERTLLCACFLVTMLFDQPFNVKFAIACYMKLRGIIPLVGLPHLNNMLLSLQLHLENWV